MFLESMALLSNNFFHTNLLILLKIQTVINSYSSMMGASNLVILVFSMRSFNSGILQVIAHNIKNSVLGEMWTRNPSYKGPISIFPSS